MSSLANGDPVKVEARFANGQLSERYEKVKDDKADYKKHGKYESWFENGYVKATGSFIMGKKNGTWSGTSGEFDKDLKEWFFVNEWEHNYLLGVPHGKWYDTGEHGSGHGAYYKGAKHGEWKYWDGGERIDRIEMYDHGCPVGTWKKTCDFYEPEEKYLVEEMEFADGRLISFTQKSDLGTSGENIEMKNSPETRHRSWLFSETRTLEAYVHERTVAGCCENDKKEGVWSYKDVLDEGREWTKYISVKHTAEGNYRDGKADGIWGYCTLDDHSDNDLTHIASGKYEDGLKSGNWIQTIEDRYSEKKELSVNFVAGKLGNDIENDPTAWTETLIDKVWGKWLRDHQAKILSIGIRRADPGYGRSDEESD